MGNYRTVLRAAFTACAFLMTQLLFSMPPHPRLIEEISTRGNLPQLTMKLETQIAKGMNASSKSFPLTGNHKVLVLMAGFNDIDFAAAATPAFYDGLFSTGPGGNGFGWRQYYQDMSNGSLNLSFDVYNVGLLSEAGSYYGSSNELNIGEYVTEAITKGDALIDYSQYDNDGDGAVDAVILIHPGQGEEVSGDDADIWSHRWNLYSATGGGTLTLDGVEINDYAVQPEYVDTPGDSTIGVFVHEFGHILGLPDLYDTSYTTDGIGLWGLMAAGAWLGPSMAGSRPAPLSAWCMEVLNWSVTDNAELPTAVPLTPGPGTQQPILIVVWLSIFILFSLLLKARKRQPGLLLVPLLFITAVTCTNGGSSGSRTTYVEVDDMDYSHTAVRVNLDSDEYLLIQNFRDNTGKWSEYLPGDGLLIYHIDNSLITARYSSNSINDYSKNGQLGVAVIEADENDSLITPGGDGAASLDLFFAGNKSSLASVPLNSGGVSPVTIENISAPGYTMSFEVFR